MTLLGMFALGWMAKDIHARIVRWLNEKEA